MGASLWRRRKTAEHGILTLRFTTIKKFNTQPPAKKKKKILLTVFWDSKHVYATDYLEAGVDCKFCAIHRDLKHLRRHVLRSTIHRADNSVRR